MYFIHVWNWSFLDTEMANCLSQWRVTGCKRSQEISVRNIQIHKASFTACVAAMYLASVVDNATIDCFFLSSRDGSPINCEYVTWDGMAVVLWRTISIWEAFESDPVLPPWLSLVPVPKGPYSEFPICSPFQVVKDMFALFPMSVAWILHELWKECYWEHDICLGPQGCIQEGSNCFMVWYILYSFILTWGIRM